MDASPTLGTLLRRLLERLDGEVEAAYDAAGLAWRPRYTPVLRALIAMGPASIKALAGMTGVSHSAVSQTVSQMKKDGLVSLEAGTDGRERIVAPTPLAQAMVPDLRRQWTATNRAAEELDAELSAPLSAVVAEALDALGDRPFGERIRAAAASLPATDHP